MVTQRDIECATKCVEECAYAFGLTENDLPDVIEAMQQIIADHVAQETKALMGVLVIAQKALSKMTVINAEEELVEVRHALTVIASKTKGGN